MQPVRRPPAAAPPALASCGVSRSGPGPFTAPASAPGRSRPTFTGVRRRTSSSIRRPDFTLSGRSARMSRPGAAAASFSLISSQTVFFSPGFGFSRTSIHPPWSFSPASRNFSSPAASPSSASSIGAQVPASQTIIGPPPYSPSGITPSKSMYSSGWSSV